MMDGNGTTVDGKGHRRDEERRQRRRLIGMRLSTFGLFLFLIVALGPAGYVLIFDMPRSLERLAFALGMIACGGMAGYGTAFLTTMEKRVPYSEKRSWWERVKRCVEMTSRLEIIVRMVIGAAVGSGAYFLARLTGAC